MSTNSAPRNIVLVHGAFVDGSSWRAVYDILTGDGYHVAVVQNPTLSLPGDVAATRLIIDAQDGPVVLVGHSYGGAVITEAGTHDKVTALVYIAAFAPDEGESVKALGGAPNAPGSPIVAAPGGFLFQERAKFHDSFGADLLAADAVFMADSQVPWAVDAMAVAGHRARLARQAKLVPDCHRRPHDPAVRPARHGKAGRRHHGRGGRQPRCLHVAAARRCRPHSEGLRLGDRVPRAGLAGRASGH